MSDHSNAKGVARDIKYEFDENGELKWTGSWETYLPALMEFGDRVPKPISRGSVEPTNSPEAPPAAAARTVATVPSGGVQGNSNTDTLEKLLIEECRTRGLSPLYRPAIQFKGIVHLGGHTVATKEWHGSRQAAKAAALTQALRLVRSWPPQDLKKEAGKAAAVEETRTENPVWTSGAGSSRSPPSSFCKEHDYESPDGYFGRSGHQQPHQPSWYSRDYRRALHSMCLVSRRFRPIAQLVLYHEFIPGYGDAWKSKKFSWDGRLASFLRTIAARPDLAARVKRVYVHPYLFRLITGEEARVTLEEAVGAIKTASGGDAVQVVTNYHASFANIQGVTNNPSWLRLAGPELLLMLLVLLPNLERLSLQVGPPTGGRQAGNHFQPSDAIRHLGRHKATLKSLHLSRPPCGGRLQPPQWGTGAANQPLPQSLKDFTALEHIFLDTSAVCDVWMWLLTHAGSSSPADADSQALTRLLPRQHHLAASGRHARPLHTAASEAVLRLAGTIARREEFTALKSVRCGVDLAGAGLDEHAVREAFIVEGVDFEYDSWPLSQLVGTSSGSYWGRLSRWPCPTQIRKMISR
ncbi:hypothetical protein QBC46DRAFT_355449 [Diplogelasinospora grovesii]|uniref:Uncharacterized protein n=1 Tax=Diplogelasinospora grovesii TaxID=303347 RepID=A0AAN6N5P7_9PEZI|nr:hypothetical protein QBC46DRAFT_355449 [Diplogelasinospora grovesii]